jgi:hypothetical protein
MKNTKIIKMLFVGAVLNLEVFAAVAGEGSEFKSALTGVKRLGDGDLHDGGWRTDELSYKQAVVSEYVELSPDNRRLVIRSTDFYKAAYECIHSHDGGPYVRYSVSAMIKDPRAADERINETYNFMERGDSTHIFNLGVLEAGAQVRFKIDHWDRRLHLETLKVLIIPSITPLIRFQTLENYITMSDSERYADAFNMLNALAVYFPKRAAYIDTVLLKTRAKLTKLIGDSVYGRNIAKEVEARTLARSFPAATQPALIAHIEEEIRAANAILAGLAPDASARLAALRSIADRLFP